MAYFILELQRGTNPGVHFYVTVNEDGKPELTKYENLEGKDFRRVNSQYRNEILRSEYEDLLHGYMTGFGLSKVRLHMLRVDPDAISLSGKCSIYRSWKITVSENGSNLIWTSINN